MPILATPRLDLRELRDSDADFILRLLNDPSWLRYIGDRGVRSLDDARRYIANGPVAMYTRLGYGLYLVERRDDGAAMGLCGLLKRDGLDDPDIGFAFFPEFGGQGYALEAARAALDAGFAQHGMARVVAITAQDNAASIRLLRAIGFVYERDVTLPGGTEALRLFAATRAA
ncbi:GNAT family N-acetyltransferase [Chiayiivirga flava]|uniref:RimJ/RimL family protein N-acetyltransferase n=1 Tax=Chiayiivirga flava TaxID=659595 RepID=A0A7W8D415_9GAMM|nr:GNAT family N-acetyltransferase [Chiayiivirga flava]MBB5207536.1 RimJ/RimL family protein N-acetyltransferase [Chiayiivirga flava]